MVRSLIYQGFVKAAEPFTVIRTGEIMDDRRKFERFDVSVPARLEMIGPEGTGEKIVLETRNLSAGGILIKHKYPLPVGSLVRMEIFLPAPGLETPSTVREATVITVSGRIIRSNEEGMAVCFNDDYDIIPTKISGDD